MSTYNPNNPFRASTATAESPWVTFGSSYDTSGARNPFDLPSDTVSPFDLPNDTNPIHQEQRGYGLQERSGNKVVRTLRLMGRKAMEALGLSGSKSPEGDQLPFGFAAQPAPDPFNAGTRSLKENSYGVFSQDTQSPFAAPPEAAPWQTPPAPNLFAPDASVNNYSSQPPFGAQAEVGLGGWGAPVEAGSSRWDAFAGRATTALGAVDRAVDTARVAANTLDRYGDTLPGRIAGLDGAAQAVDSALNTYDTAKSAAEGLRQNPEELGRIVTGMGKTAVESFFEATVLDAEGNFSANKAVKTAVKAAATRGGSLVRPATGAARAGLSYGAREAARVAQPGAGQDIYRRGW